MIRVVIFDADGSLRCGGAELVLEARNPPIAGWIDMEAEPEAAEKLMRGQK